MMNGKNASIKQAWVSVVDAQNIKDAKREAGKKLWFSLSPGKERFIYFGHFFGHFRLLSAEFQTEPLVTVLDLVFVLG